MGISDGFTGRTGFLGPIFRRHPAGTPVLIFIADCIFQFELTGFKDFLGVVRKMKSKKEEMQC
jgi:hypothetical protein